MHTLELLSVAQKRLFVNPNASFLAKKPTKTKTLYHEGTGFGWILSYPITTLYDYFFENVPNAGLPFMNTLVMVSD